MPKFSSFVLEEVYCTYLFNWRDHAQLPPASGSRQSCRDPSVDIAGGRGGYAVMVGESTRLSWDI